jgi:hypothetical protein
MRLKALPFVFVVAAAVPSAAQQLVCYPVQSGDTAARFALRLTGSVDNQYAPWFRVVDAHARTVPKSQYARIVPGWRVCVTGSSAPAPRVALGVVQQQRPLVDPIVDRMYVRYGAAGLILVAALLAFVVAVQIVNERQAILDRMRDFGDRFVREFERPLFRYPVARAGNPRTNGHPVRSRLRFPLRRNRMEILLAPHDGRAYPNLSDHRKNLEYDIERVLEVLGDPPFTPGKLYAEGRWVVIPFSLRRSNRP